MTMGVRNRPVGRYRASLPRFPSGRMPVARHAAKCRPTPGRQFGDVHSHCGGNMTETLCGTGSDMQQRVERAVRLLSPGEAELWARLFEAAAERYALVRQPAAPASEAASRARLEVVGSGPQASAGRR